MNPIFSRTRLAFLAALVAIAAIFAAPSSVPSSQAATPGVAVGAGQVMPLVFHLSGTYSATKTALVRFQMPQACDLISIGANAQAISGTTNTLDVKVGGTTVLSAVITFAAATTWYEGTISTVRVARDAVVTVDYTNVATSTSDITLIIQCARV
jgi:hypothetical protein